MVLRRESDAVTGRAACGDDCDGGDAVHRTPEAGLPVYDARRATGGDETGGVAASSSFRANGGETGGRPGAPSAPARVLLAAAVLAALAAPSAHAGAVGAAAGDRLAPPKSNEGGGSASGVGATWPLA